MRTIHRCRITTVEERISDGTPPRSTSDVSEKVTVVIGYDSREFRERLGLPPDAVINEIVGYLPVSGDIQLRYTIHTK